MTCGVGTGCSCFESIGRNRHSVDGCSGRRRLGADRVRGATTTFRDMSRRGRVCDGGLRASCVRRHHLRA